MAIVLRSPSSASSSSSASMFSYDVFLSFRSEDTRKTFTDHLYTALKQIGIRIFRDDDAMERGRLLKPELEKAIQQSQVSLIVFSKSYATSKWCLDEVLMIMKLYEQRGREAVPVFYNIDPTDVQNQTGCFEDAFKGYDDEVKRETDVEKKKELSDKVKAWRDALRKAGSLTGMVLSTDGYEAEFISNIVKVIRKKVNYNALYIENNLVGITENVAEIESWLQDPSPDALILVIAGMGGGIGKTTIVKFIYNTNFGEYDGSSFLANINQASSQPNGMFRLHIACFFVGEDEDWVVKLLAGCNLNPIIGIKNLKDSCLLDSCLLYVGQRKVGMHQLIREMGQNVVRQESPKSPNPGNRSRLWNHEDCLNVLQENLGTEKVKGLLLDMQKVRETISTLAITMDNPRKRKRGILEYLRETIYGKEATFKIEALENMKNLMLLQLNYATVSGKSNKLPKKLRLLRWHGFSLQCIPCDIPMEKLVILDMSYSKLTRVWDGFKIIESLKILNLSYSFELIKTPDFRGLPGLERLILKGCISLTKVHESIAYLKELVLLDLTDCRSLRNVPCVPRSVVSLHMSGCPIVAAVGGYHFLESISLASLLVRLNISDCNLFDNSFPNDWSNLVSLEMLTIDGNNVTYLPKCIQNLPTLTVLFANRCSQIQSILGLPETVEFLNANGSMSLDKIQAPPKSNIYTLGCPKLCLVEGRYKWQSIEKVEKKVIQNLGLRMELGLDYNKQKVLFEYGIFSTYITQEQQIPPSSFFTYKERGPQISFVVPVDHHRRIISGFSLCLVFSPLIYFWNQCKIKVFNKTKDLEWIYSAALMSENNPVIGKGWSSVWRCGNLFHEWGEKELWGVEECCVNLVYEEEEDNNIEKQEEERKEEGDIFINDKVVMSEDNDNNEIIMRWSDRMDYDISDCIHPGMTYQFGIPKSGGRGFYSHGPGRIVGQKREEVAGPLKPN